MIGMIRCEMLFQACSDIQGSRDVMIDRVELCKSYAKRSVVDLIYRATVVEGLGTTYLKTEKILDNLPVNTTREEVCFILNMKHAYEFIFDTIGEHISIHYLRELHKIVGRDLIYDCGVLRSYNVSIGGTTWRPEIPIYDKVKDELLKINGIRDPITKAMVCFCYITRSQLFSDGNKRLAQLITNKVLIENGVGIFKIPYEDDTWKELLLRYYESNDASMLCEYLCTKCIEMVGN